MPKPYKPRMKLKEGVKRSQVDSLKSREGYLSNAQDRSEALYRKGTRNRTTGPVREMSSSIRSSRRQRTARARAY